MDSEVRPKDDLHPEGKSAIPEAFLSGSASTEPVREGWLARTELLLGEDEVTRLKGASVLVVGLGGVGAYAAEMLVRAGIGKMCIVDGDTVQTTNLNRQLGALTSQLGRPKAEVLAARFRDINPDIDLRVIAEYIRDERMKEILQMEKYDYVVDAIDTLSPKIYLLFHCRNLGIPVVSAMGSGGRIDPLQLQIADISQTYCCSLADVLRKRLHRLGIYYGIKAVFSPEPVRKESIKATWGEPNKKSTLGTVSYMPPMVGCLCASVVIRELLGQKLVSKLPVPPSVKKRMEEEGFEF